MIAGFIVNGTAAKRVLLRAIGPSLRSDGTPVAGRLDDPTLELLDQNGQRITFNDNWKDSPDRADIEASGLAPEDDREAVITRALSEGPYTAVMGGKDGATGVGLIEAYDRSSGANAEMANISTRAAVEADDNVLIGGFIVGSQHPGTRVLVRALGPSLKSQLPNALDDPQLQLFDANGAPLASNDNWKDSEQREEIEATGIPPSNDAEAAIIRGVTPAPYTAIVRGANDTTGIGLVEVYNVK